MFAEQKLKLEMHIKLWRTFQMGGVSRQKLKKRIWKYLSDFAEDLLNSEEFPVLSSKEKIPLARVLVRDLFGFDHPISAEVFLASALNPNWLAEWSRENAHRLPHGCALGLLPPEAGPQIRYKLRKLKSDESLWIATQPMYRKRPAPSLVLPKPSVPRPSIFSVECLGHRIGKGTWRYRHWLSAYEISSDVLPDTWLVYRLVAKANQDAHTRQRALFRSSTLRPASAA
jgi:hypothetical protein